MKLIFAGFLIISVFLQMAGAQNQAGTSAVSQQAIGKDYSWVPPAGTLGKIRDKVAPSRPLLLGSVLFQE